VTAPENRPARLHALIAAELRDADGSADWLGQLCRVAVRELPASGVGVSLITDSETQGVAAASDSTSEVVEELQFTLGEGPCLQARASRRPVLVPDLAAAALTRWPAYAPAAREHGVQAVFAFPLQIGAARLGALDIYRDEVGSLSGKALNQALTCAEVALMILLDEQERAGPEGMGGGVESYLGQRVELYQAQGMVQVQLGVSATEALVRLRAHAFANGRRLGDVARDVVARRLTLERDTL
jgi:GAF domain-containing protein/ANTAR domain-containing protein